MKYTGMPAGMWAMFSGSFRKQLSAVYGYDPKTAKMISAKAKPRYKEIIHSLPEFDKADRFNRQVDTPLHIFMGTMILSKTE